MAPPSFEISLGSFLLSDTIVSILRACGFEGEIPTPDSIKIPRFHSSSAHKCDLTIPVIGRVLPYADVPLTNFSDKLSTLRISVNLEELKDALPSLSASWSLPIKSCCYSKHSFCICFDREKAFASTFSTIVDKGTTYGLFPQNGKKIIMTRDPAPDIKDMELRQLRLELAFQGLIRVFVRLGHSVMVGEESLSIENPSNFVIHLCTKSTCSIRAPGSIHVLCGPVHTLIDGRKNKTINSDFYFRQKEYKLKHVEKNKDIEDSNEIHIQTLSKAEAIAELLRVKLCDSVSITVRDDLTDHNGASFILYNHVRLVAIRRRYEELRRGLIYPDLPPIHLVNFQLLVQEEEWVLFLQLLRFPYWLVSCINNVGEGKASLHPILIGLDKLCRVTSVYYRRVRILTEPRDHLLPVMFARLYMLQAVEYVLQNGLNILGINTLSYM